MTSQTQERKVGGRVLRSGDVVRVIGQRGLFKVEHFAGDEVTCYGGVRNREQWRTFVINRIGARKRMT